MNQIPSGTRVPDAWVVVELPGSGETKHLLCGYKGGYLDGDGWTMSTPVVEVTPFGGDALEVHTKSGSKYILHPNRFGKTQDSAAVKRRFELVELTQEQAEEYLKEKMKDDLSSPQYLLNGE